MLAGWTGLIAILFAEALFGGRVFFYRDIHVHWLPGIEGFVRAVAEGSWPLWDPSNGFGKPMLADPNLGFAYPLTWLNLLMLPASYYRLLVVVHLLGGALGIERLLRRSGLPRLTRFAAGGLWIASGPLLSAVDLFHHFSASAWLPWVLLATKRLLERPSPGRALALGALAAGQSLTGSPDLCVMTGLIVAVMLAVALRRGESRGALLGASAGAALFAFALAAVQWLPALAIVGTSARSGLDPASSAYWSLHPLRLLELIVPVRLGALPLSAGVRAELLEGREPFLASLYVGSAAAGLLAAGLIAAGGARRRLALVAGVGFVVSIAIALGRHAPLYPLLHHLPPVAVLRYPVKFAIPAVLFWTALAGCGLAAWLEPWRERQARRGARAALAGLAVAAGLLAAAVWAGQRLGPDAGFFAAEQAAAASSRVAQRLAWAATGLGLAAGLTLLRARSERPGGALRAAALVVLLGDVVLAGRGVSPLAPAELLAHRPPLVEAIEADAAPRRLHVEMPPRDWRLARFTRGPLGWPPEARWALGNLEMLRPPLSARWGIDGSYHGDITGLAPTALSAASVLVNRHRRDLIGARLLRLGGVTHVIALEPGLFGGLPEIAAEASVYDVPVRLYRVPDALPRAFAVSGVRRADEAAALELLADPVFDPLREVALPEVEARSAADGFSGRVQVVGRDSDSVQLEAELSHPGYAVLLEAFDRGWRGSVDGEPVPVLPANALFRAVPVPSGRHRVELRYHPPAAAWGAALSAVAAAVGVAAALRHRGEG